MVGAALPSTSVSRRAQISRLRDLPLSHRNFHNPAKPPGLIDPTNQHGIMNDNDRTRTAGEENINPAEAVSEAKGKGKASESITQNMSMDEDDDSSDEETGAEEDVWFLHS